MYVDSESELTRLTYFRGRVALYNILKALGVGRGDDVALSAYTCVAVPEALLALEAQPVWVDLKPDGLTMDPDHAESVITSRTRAVIVQHTFGVPADMDRLMALAGRRGIPLIEDCCHTLRSTYKGRVVGSLGTASFYSFEWGKPIVAGMGGSAVTADEGLRQKLSRQNAVLQEPPLVRDLKIEIEYLGYRLIFRPALYWIAKQFKNLLDRFGVIEPSYNSPSRGAPSTDFLFRMAPLSRRRLERVRSDIQRVADHSTLIAGQYRERICTSYVAHPAIDPGSNVVFGRYPLTSRHKEAIMRLARKAMVEVAGWYSSPIHPLTQQQWRSVGYTRGCCPNAERRACEVLTLPTHAKVTQWDVDRTVEFLNCLQL
ncbi:MAG: DegT/DnrJ/EryC1/StrS family aminotransferase [Acidobacteriales bacterium]|nr:DegT/DnrJ/EryC1/StrS family aminotransferase [Terriglobales bacterium]